MDKMLIPKREMVLGAPDCVWLCIRVTFFANVFGLHTDGFVLTEFKVSLAVFSFVVGCGSTFARALPNMPQSYVMATGQSLHVFLCWGKRNF